MANQECQLTFKRARRGWDKYMRALKALEAAHGRHHNLNVHGRRDGNPKKETLRKATMRSNEAVRSANGAVDAAKKEFLRVEKALSSCMKKAG